ncbi:MAG TPA: NTP transferase domain-containing protein [Acidimicrobiales bacterium]|nr:NTP transferase domain-containing protein [Acidimicrobiales bacterium]
MGRGSPVLVVLAAGRARRYGGCKPLAPIGPNGEAVIDLLAGDALTAGFSTLVLVVGPATGAAIRYHVEHVWPRSLDVHFALQEAPLGTVDAVLAASGRLGGTPFVVANADDLYGPDALALARAHVADTDHDAPNALVGFRLRSAVVGREPVTRGVCRSDAAGRLLGIEERRQVQPLDHDRFSVKDGHEPTELDGDVLVSMNLFGFAPGIIGHLESAMATRTASVDSEVLLPEVVSNLAASGAADAAVRVLPTEDRCIGVTHPGDLELVQAEVKRLVATGQRPAGPWG